MVYVIFLIETPQKGLETLISISWGDPVYVILISWPVESYGHWKGPEEMVISREEKKYD